MAVDNNMFGGNMNNMIDPNQRIAVNNAQIQRNNAQINQLGGNSGYMAPNTYGNSGYMNGGYYGQQPTQPQFLKCRPVTSIEEARAAQIDLDGSLWVFVDPGHGKIYTKQIRNDASSSFGVYNYIGEDQPNYNINNNNNNLNNYVTKEELSTAIQYVMNLLPKQQQQSQNNAATADVKNDKTNTLSF